MYLMLYLAQKKVCENNAEGDTPWFDPSTFIKINCNSVVFLENYKTYLRAGCISAALYSFKGEAPMRAFILGASRGRRLCYSAGVVCHD